MSDENEVQALRQLVQKLQEENATLKTDARLLMLACDTFEKNSATAARICEEERKSMMGEIETLKAKLQILRQVP